jgi:hypothetical protein
MLVPDPVSGSFIPDPDPNILPISDPGSRRQKDTGSRIQGSTRHWIPDPYPQHKIADKPVNNIRKFKKFKK